MEPTNPAPPATPANPISPQPLNTGGVVRPTEMPMGSPIPPAGGVSGEGLPPQATAATSATSSGGSKKMMMIAMIIILVIAILGVGGYYFYSMQGNNAPAEEGVMVEDDPDLVQLQTETSEIELADPQEEITQISSEINMLEATPSASASSSARPRL